MFIDAIAAWLVTVFLHLGLVLGLARLLTARLEAGPWRERLWRLALCGALVTAGVQTCAGNGPLVWHLTGDAALSSIPVRLGAPTDQLVAPFEALPAPGDSLDSAQPAARNSAAGGLGAWRRAAAGLVGAWLFGVVFLCARQWLRRRRFIESLSRERLHGDLQVRRTLEELRPRACRRFALRLSVAQGLNSPVVLSKREICLPARALEEFSPRELRATLAHELAHVLRRDPLWLRTYGLLEALFFFQPAVRWATRALRAEAELACDDWAVARGADPLGLAHSLARIAAWAPSAPAVLSAMVGHETGLVQRVRRLTTKEGGRVSRARTAVCFATLALGLGVFACGGPGVKTEEVVLLDDTVGSADGLFLRLPLLGDLFAEGRTYRLLAEAEELRALLEERNGLDSSGGPNDVSDLRVVIDVEEGVRFSKVQKLMEELGRARIWRIEFATSGGRTLAVPLRRDLADLAQPVEEESVLEVVDEGEVPDSPAEIRAPIDMAQRATIELAVRKYPPREVEYRLGLLSCNSLEMFEQKLHELQAMHPLKSVVVDVKPGVHYADVLALLDALMSVGLSGDQIAFVGTREIW
jgi:beta-lactamase regulating signal transducer with metallopeptidase domain/biopolymer transport protein ExbD